MQKIYAFVPARAGSERVKNKNLKLLNNKPLIQYTFDLINKSKYIDKTYVSTDIKNLDKLVNLNNNIEVIKRPASISKSSSLDIDWIMHLLAKIKNDLPDIIVLLRPTSPFREVRFLDEAIKSFINTKKYDSSRAVRLVSEHPDKMWKRKGNTVIPYNGFRNTNEEDLHSMQYKSLDKLYIQTSSLEILKTSSIQKNKKLAGKKVLPIYSDFINSFTIDYEIDFKIAELIVNNKLII
tara:strand:+ start:278 stop:988 length:711 start_codon:yes stop_codon:yes gene_type:complete